MINDEIKIKLRITVKALVVLLFCGIILYFLYFMVILTIPELMYNEVYIYNGSTGEMRTEVTTGGREYFSVFFFLVPCGITLYFICRIVIIVITRLINRSPKEPELLATFQEVDEATARGDWYDDSDIYRLDMAIANAEMEKPGSTLALYTGHPHITIVDMFLLAIGLPSCMIVFAISDLYSGICVLFLITIGLIFFVGD